MLILPELRAPAVYGTARENQPKISALIKRFRMTAWLSVVALAALTNAYGAQPPASRTQTLASNEPQPQSAVDLAATVVHGDGAAAIVNDTVISDYDLRQRMGLFIATSGVRPTEDALKEIREQVLKQLETERLQLLEAQKNNVAVSASDVDKAIDSIITDNHLTMDQLKNVLAKGGVEMATLRSQIASSIAWSKLVQDQLGDRVHVTPEDVNAELDRIKRGADKPHFLVSEIFQAVDAPEQDTKVLKDMTDLDAQIQQGAPFNAVARQFSQNPTAAGGGDLGWVLESQLPGELATALKTMHPGDVTPPIRASGGYYILQLRDRQEPVGTKVADLAPAPSTPPGTLPLARVLLPIGPKPAKDLAQRALQAATVMRTHIRGCSGLQEIVAKMPGAVYMSLGTMKLADLSADMQNAIAKTEAGDSTVPFPSPAGVEIIVRCDKAAPKAPTVIVIPTRDQVEQQLYEEQMTVQARRYMRDLRREADVETR